MIQPTVVDPKSFMHWKDEAFDYGIYIYIYIYMYIIRAPLMYNSRALHRMSQWGTLYEKESDSYQVTLFLDIPLPPSSPLVSHHSSLTFTLHVSLSPPFILLSHYTSFSTPPADHQKHARLLLPRQRSW